MATILTTILMFVFLLLGIYLMTIKKPSNLINILGMVCAAITAVLFCYVCLNIEYEAHVEQENWVKSMVTKSCRVIGFAGADAQPVWICPDGNLTLQPYFQR